MHLNAINGILFALKTKQNRKSCKASKETVGFMVSAEAWRRTHYPVFSQFSSELSEHTLQITAETKDRRGKKKTGLQLHSAPWKSKVCWILSNLLEQIDELVCCLYQLLTQSRAYASSWCWWVVLLHCLPHSLALCRGVGMGAVTGGHPS